jgi:hypothetical protein
LETEKVQLKFFYKVVALPILLYGSEYFAVKTSDLNRMTISQVLCQLKGCTRLDHIRNELNWERTENTTGT